MIVNRSINANTKIMNIVIIILVVLLLLFKLINESYSCSPYNMIKKTDIHYLSSALRSLPLPTLLPKS